MSLVILIADLQRRMARCVGSRGPCFAGGGSHLQAEDFLSWGTFSSWGHYHLKARMMEEQLSPDLPPDPFLGPHLKIYLFFSSQKESSGNLAMHQIVHYCAKCLYLKIV